MERFNVVRCGVVGCEYISTVGFVVGICGCCSGKNDLLTTEASPHR